MARSESVRARFTLIPPRGLEQAALAMTRGAVKHDEPDGADRWRTRETMREHLAAALRHIFKRLAGERIDPEFGLPHLAHAGARVLMACELDLSGTEKTPKKRLTRLPRP